MIAAAADYATVADGKLTIFGIFQEVNVRREPLPVVLPLAFFITQVQVEPREFRRDYKATLRLRDPQGQLLLELESVFRIDNAAAPDRPAMINMPLGMAGLAFPIAGLYRFELEIQNGPKASVEIMVHGPA